MARSSAACESSGMIGFISFGGKLSKASQEVSTSAPMRSGRRVTTIWQMAPPVSLPTSVTSSSSSASIASAIRSATAGGERSASGAIGTTCEPNGRSSVTQRKSALSSATTLRHRFALTRAPWTNTIGRPAADAEVADGALRQRELTRRSEALGAPLSIACRHDCSFAYRQYVSRGTVTYSLYVRRDATRPRRGDARGAPHRCPRAVRRTRLCGRSAPRRSCGAPG